MIFFNLLSGLQATGNLVSNPGFEETAGGLALFWESSPGQAARVHLEQGYDGLYGMAIGHQAPEHTQLSQEVAVEPASLYLLSCRVKTGDVGAGSRGAYIAGVRNDQPYPHIQGTSAGWEELAVYGRTGKHQTSFRLVLGLGESGAGNGGRAWFDEVRMVRVSRVPRGITPVLLFDEARERNFLSANLVKNAGFELSGKDGVGDWQNDVFANAADSVRIYPSGEQALLGDFSMTIENLLPADSRVYQEIKVKQEAYYLASCWVKTTGIDLDGRGAHIGVANSAGGSREIKGTNARWEYLEVCFKTARKQNRLVLSLRLGGASATLTGKAAFDHVFLARVKEPPGNMVVELNTDTAPGLFDSALLSDILIWFYWGCVFLTLALGTVLFLFRRRFKPRTLKTGKTLTLMAASGLFTLLVLEAGLRLLNVQAAIQTKDFNYSDGFCREDPHPGLPCEPAPFAHVTFKYYGVQRAYFDADNSITSYYNSLGFREREYPLDKPAHTFRIIGLGDSFTEGEGVKFEDLYLKILEARLNNGQADRNYEVINLGRSGYATNDEYRVLQIYGYSFSPDLVILNYVLNDCSDEDLKKNGYVYPQADFISQEFNHFRAADTPSASRLLSFIQGKMKLISLSRATVRYYNLLYTELNAAGWYSVQNTLAHMNAEITNQGARLVVVVWPLLFNLEHYPMRKVHEALAQVCNAQNIPCLDLLPVLKKFKTASLWVHVTDYHPNETAQRAAAQAVYDFILEEKLLFH